MLLLRRLGDPASRPTPAFVYVDGWKPDGKHAAIGREAGVELLLELPRVVGADGDLDVRAMLDRAARA